MCLVQVFKAMVFVSLLVLALPNYAGITYLGQLGGNVSKSGALTADDLLSGQYHDRYCFMATANGTLTVSNFKVKTGSAFFRLYSTAASNIKWLIPDKTLDNFNADTDFLPIPSSDGTGATGAVKKNYGYVVDVYYVTAGATYSFDLSAPGGGGGGGGTSLSISPASASKPASSCTGSFTVTANTSWTVSSSASWLKITSSTKGSGNGMVTYQCDSNSSTSSRTGRIYVVFPSGEAMFSVTQSGAAVPPSPSKPDLRPIVLSGYGDSLIISTAWNAHTGSTSFYDTDSIYVSWSMGCYGKSVSQMFHTALYVDGNKVNRWYTNSLGAGGYIYAQNHPLGRLSPGTHVIKVSVDDEGEVGESNGDNNTVSKVITVKARPLTLFFDANGGLNSTSAMQVTYGAKVGALPTPSRNGYSFDGWYTTRVSGGSHVTSSTLMSVAADVTLYARWSPRYYTITLNANGGSCSRSAVGTYFDMLVGTLPTPTRKGYDFDGWWYGSVRVTSSTKMTSAGDITLFAHWKKTVPVAGSCRSSALAATIGVGSGVQSVQVALVAEYANDEYTSMGVRYYKLTLEGGHFYTFAVPSDGTDIDADGSNGSVRVEGYNPFWGLRYVLVDATALRTGSATVYLKLSGSAGKVATLYYSEGNLLPTGCGLNPEMLPGSAAGGRLSVSGTRDIGNSYSFGADLQPGILYDLSLDGALRAWIKIDAPHPEAIVEVEDSIDDATDRTSFTRKLFRSTVAQRVVLYCDHDVKAGSTEVPSYACVARWAFVADDAGLRLFFNPNGGDCATREREVSYLENVGSLPVPVRDGYAFDGWYTAQEGGAKVNEATPMSVVNDVTLFAHWIWLTPGSCAEREIAVAVDRTVRNEGFSLVNAWRDGAYQSEGCLYVRFSLTAGRVYTLAKPIDAVSWDGHIEEGIRKARIESFTDGRLEYIRVDLSAVQDPFGLGVMFHPQFFGRAGATSLLYYVEGDYVPSDAEAL